MQKFFMLDGDETDIAEPADAANVAQQVASRKLVAEVMRWPAVAVSPQLPVREAEALARACRVRHLAVTEGETVVGALCVCDLWWSPEHSIVSERMTAPAITISPGATLQQAVWQMLLDDVGFLPVVRGRTLCGVLSRGDLVRAGVLEASPNRRCLVCGSAHHLRALVGGPRKLLCVQCLAERTADEIAPYLRRPARMGVAH